MPPVEEDRGIALVAVASLLYKVCSAFAAVQFQTVPSSVNKMLSKVGEVISHFSVVCQEVISRFNIPIIPFQSSIKP